MDRERPSSHITARVHDVVYRAIEDYAARESVTFSEAVRQLLTRGVLHYADQPPNERWDFGPALDQLDQG